MKNFPCSAFGSLVMMSVVLGEVVINSEAAPLPHLPLLHCLLAFFFLVSFNTPTQICVAQQSFI
jgi:hypothetical protein